MKLFLKFLEPPKFLEGRPRGLLSIKIRPLPSSELKLKGQNSKFVRHGVAKYLSTFPGSAFLLPRHVFELRLGYCCFCTAHGYPFLPRASALDAAAAAAPTATAAEQTCHLQRTRYFCVQSPSWHSFVFSVFFVCAAASVHVSRSQSCKHTLLGVGQVLMQHRPTDQEAGGTGGAGPWPPQPPRASPAVDPISGEITVNMEW